MDHGAGRPPAKVKPSRVWLWMAGPWPVLGLVSRYTPVLYHGDAETARLFLTTLLTALVTVLSLSVSVVWIGVQLSASQFGGRGLDYYLRFPYHIPMLAFFLATVLRGGWHLSALRGEGALGEATARALSGDAILAVLSVAFLLFYMVRVVRLLHPEAVVDVIGAEFERALEKGQILQVQRRAEQILFAAVRAAREGDWPTVERCFRWFTYLLARTRGHPEGPEIETVWLLRWPQFAGIVLRLGDPELAREVFKFLHRWGSAAVGSREWGRGTVVVQVYRALLPSLAAGGDGRLAAFAAGTLAHWFLVGWAVSSPWNRARIRFVRRLFDVLVEVAEHLTPVSPTMARLVGHRILMGSVCPAYAIWAGMIKKDFDRRPVEAFLRVAAPWLREAEAEDVSVFIRRLQRDCCRASETRSRKSMTGAGPRAFRPCRELRIRLWLWCRTAGRQDLAKRVAREWKCPALRGKGSRP
ncbi:MAG: DUF2254 domain-containing protein [Alicyclobacillaceae bacterium]|nr:DUF2254 domain-containing protein [Alicyclobacillaceae bacterium]